ncbi:MAG: glucose-6-phosphate isomerase [Chlamydiae bacterium]|nr:glucose-6-phosphate isomerase [Chlamydiota bacterium]
MNFDRFIATKKLRELAKKAPDLTKDGALDAKRVEEMVVSGCQLRLLFSTERVNQEILHALEELAEESEACKKMAMIQNMEMVNYIEGYASENRAVGHTAMRGFFNEKKLSKKAREAAELEKIEIEKFRNFYKKVEGKYTDVAVVGIGGSYLGTQAVYNALSAYQKCKARLHFISNVDPDNMASALQEVDLKKTLVVVVSKSGGTLEIVSNEEVLRHYFESKGVNPKEHFVCVTGEKSPMDNPNLYAACFYLWDFVGGRYSVSSMVGVVPLGLTLGFDVVLEFLQGMHEMDQHVLETNPRKNIALMSALLDVWNRNFMNCPNLAIIPYAYGMSRFPAHLQQLIMESNGKHITQEGEYVNFGTSQTIFGEPGTDSQHSFFQCLHQGTDVVPIEFIGFRESQHDFDKESMGTSQRTKLNANLFAQAIALATGKKDENKNRDFKGNRQSRILLAKKLTPQILGQILSYYEHKTAFTGAIWHINSFDQEGVQLGKKLSLSILDLYKERAHKKGATPHPAQKEVQVAEAFIKHMENLEAPHIHLDYDVLKKHAQ